MGVGSDPVHSWDRAREQVQGTEAREGEEKGRLVEAVENRVGVSGDGLAGVVRVSLS